MAFLALVIVMVFVLSSVLGGGGGGSSSGGTEDLGGGIKGRLSQMPDLPPGLLAESEYVVFEATDQSQPATIELPLKEQPQDATGLGFYTFFGGRWQRLADVRLTNTKVAQGDFTSLPTNLAVLKVTAQTYQVAGSIPAGGTLHAEAKLTIASPRDYTPAADGSVQGTATAMPTTPRTFQVMPTIVGSGPDSANVVNQIIQSQDLRGKHVQAIVSLVQNGGFDGIDLEYSSVDPNLTTAFTDFVKSLSDSLHQNNKRLSLTLPPPSSQGQAYDWKALGKAADIIKVLPIADPVAYWQTMPGALGQLVQDVDRSKVMLVVSPFSIESAGNAARPIGYLEAMLKASEVDVLDPKDPTQIMPGVTVKLAAKNLDSSEGASALSWSDDAKAVTFATGGGTQNRVYIENSFSTGFKLELVQSYGLGGLAVADASAQSDVANVWPSVNGLVSSATLTLRRPNDTSLLPTWQAPDGGDLGAGAGTTATWVAPNAGTYGIVLVVSDGERRFGRKTSVDVVAGDQGSPTPLVTFPPETPTPEPTPEPTATPATSPSPIAGLHVTVHVASHGNNPGSGFSNDTTTSPGSSVVYQVTIDNDGSISAKVTSLDDNVYANVDCQVSDGNNVVGSTIAPGEQARCTYTVTAPPGSGVSVANTVTVSVSGSGGANNAAQGSAKITTS